MGCGCVWWDGVGTLLRLCFHRLLTKRMVLTVANLRWKGRGEVCLRRFRLTLPRGRLMNPPSVLALAWSHSFTAAVEKWKLSPQSSARPKPPNERRIPCYPQELGLLRNGRVAFPCGKRECWLIPPGFLISSASESAFLQFTSSQSHPFWFLLRSFVGHCNSISGQHSWDNSSNHSPGLLTRTSRQAEEWELLSNPIAWFVILFLLWAKSS